MKPVVIVVGMLGLLGGCASSPAQSPWLMSRGAAIPMNCAPLSQDQELNLNLAQKTAEEGRLHAALANLERLPSDLPQARLYKARILRSLNRPEARELYASLVDTCLKAQGEHGLGQLASAQGHYDEALRHLRLAANLDPTSDTLRNDLGVVYMNLGRMDEARFELLTALELNEAEKQPALNLLTLLLYQGNQPQASALAARMGFSAGELRMAEQRAQALRSQFGVAGAAPSQAGASLSPFPGANQDPSAAVAPAETRAVPAQQPAPAAKPATPLPVASSAVTHSPSVPAPRLSNFRPKPVVPLSVASATSKLPVVPAALQPVVPRPAVASAGPSPSAIQQVAAAPAVVGKPTAPVVAATPALRAPDESLASVASVDEVATAAPPSKPAGLPAGQGRAGIEMRAGRLIVPEDGGVIRVEPISGA
ncbi:Flp pilus assembly protein TadD, contains TPR repeats [Pseudomonas flavescens]|uniref:Flp pilus assembly protein TadD, contains TPR repeats n=1 Tax=Phytopseudomonas flavescens TaxID=29435 RepID=A0A1G8AS34_9GAMM|nr:tetratricopeptide repeat protein [Pseudomonas flavescens]SDH23737.1 Flp pilus assembly protein TadD, contains TPR repeats [Pseudomonas flavescens]